MVQEELKRFSTELILETMTVSSMEWFVFKVSSEPEPEPEPEPEKVPKKNKRKVIPSPIGSNHLSLTVTNLT
jgi:hypothetical protein